jgi:hypothetical protein
MAGAELTRAKAGGPYQWRDQNKVIDEVERLGRIRVVGADFRDGPCGAAIRMVPGDWCYASVTSGTGAGGYAWSELYASDGGTWVDGVMSGTPDADPAYEANGMDVATFPVRAILRRAPETAEWIFFLDQCG